jgi:hypothetical protein
MRPCWSESKRLPPPLTDRCYGSTPDFQAQFSKTEETRRERFEAFVAEQTSAATTEISNAATRFGEAQLKFEEDAGSAISTLRSYERQAAELASAVAALDVAGGYGKYAGEEEKYANRWRLIGVGLALAGAAWVVVTILPLLIGSTLAGVELSFLARLVGATPAFLLAVYAFRESSKHRRASREARSTSLQFAALEPFIALLPDGERATVRTKMAEKLFQPSIPAEQVTSEPLVELLGKVIDKLPKP